jgi:hypothetical protein
MQTSGADGGTEASAEDDVVAISAISDTTVVKKEWRRTLTKKIMLS